MASALKIISQLVFISLLINTASGFSFRFVQKNSHASTLVTQPSTTALKASFRSRFVSESEIKQSRQKEPAPPINGNIVVNSEQVRVIAPKLDSDAGEEEMLGIFTLEEAIEKAEEYELDLVLINDNADPPVCKIIDYGKHKYQIEKRKKDNAKKQIKVDQKEVKLSYKIEQHDFDVRVRNAQRFLIGGDRVKVILTFKGRENQFKGQGPQILMKFFQPLSEIGTAAGPPKFEGRQVTLIINPKKTA